MLNRGNARPRHSRRPLHRRAADKRPVVNAWSPRTVKRASLAFGPPMELSVSSLDHPKEEDRLVVVTIQIKQQLRAALKTLTTVQETGIAQRVRNVCISSSPALGHACNLLRLHQRWRLEQQCAYKWKTASWTNTARAHHGPSVYAKWDLEERLANWHQPSLRRSMTTTLRQITIITNSEFLQN